MIGGAGSSIPRNRLVWTVEGELHLTTIPEARSPDGYDSPSFESRVFRDGETPKASRTISLAERAVPSVPTRIGSSDVVSDIWCATSGEPEDPYPDRKPSRMDGPLLALVLFTLVGLAVALRPYDLARRGADRRRGEHPRERPRVGRADRTERPRLPGRGYRDSHRGCDVPALGALREFGTIVLYHSPSVTAS